jgi:hypothetical protein
LRLNAETVLENGAKVSDFVYDRTWKDYLADMSRDKIWGDHLTLIAATEIFNKSIVVVSSIPNEHYLLEISPNILTKGIPSGKIFLSHLTEFHYGSIQEKKDVEHSVVNFKVITL